MPFIDAATSSENSLVERSALSKINNTSTNFSELFDSDSDDSHDDTVVEDHSFRDVSESSENTLDFLDHLVDSKSSDFDAAESKVGMDFIGNVIDASKDEAGEDQDDVDLHENDGVSWPLL